MKPHPSSQSSPGDFGFRMLWVCVQEELEAFEKRQQRGGRRSKRRGRREEVDEGRDRSARWRRCAAVILIPLGGALLSAAAFYLLSSK